MTRALRSLPALGWAGLIFFLSSQSTLPQVLPFSFADKLEHCSVYAVLCLLIIAALGTLKRKHLVLAALITSAYGCSDEVHQMFVPGRTPDVLDWVADTVGAILIAGALDVWRKRHDSTI